MSEFEYQYSGCKGSTVYASLKKVAENFEYEVIEANPANYKLKRLNDGQIDIKTKNEVEKLLILKPA
ncbi:MAG: hypothetical protein HWN81_00390 [Candidatus Lokiarchaeota archaeon]|nr:hypothetical protein [Candidatus Lokiarchaeota archaeon]